MICMIFIKILKKQETKNIFLLFYFDYMIPDMLSNENIYPIVTELFVKSRKINTFCCFCHTILFWCAKNVRLNSTHYFIMKIPNKRELQTNCI